MQSTWRELLTAHSAVPPEAEPLAGDIDLLVPVEPDWRVLDLSDGYGARAEVLARRCTQVIAATREPTAIPILTARAHEVPQGRMVPILVDRGLPFDPQSFDLLVHQGDEPYPLEQLLPLLKPGGWILWLHEGESTPGVDLQGLDGLLSSARAGAAWLQKRLAAPTHWRRRLNLKGLEDIQIYIQVREYAWGYLPFEAYWLQRYYLESLQEEAVGGGRGRAKVARLLGKGGVYPFLASAHVVVARVPREEP